MKYENIKYEKWMGYPFTERELKDMIKEGGFGTVAGLIYLALSIEDNRENVDRIKPKEFCQKWGFKQSSYFQGIKQLRKKGLIPPSTREYSAPEQKVQKRLHAQLGGKREVKTDSGFIDLLTDTQIIEVKEISRWKEALGQVLSYGLEYPDHEKRIHLFGENNNNLDHIRKVCDQYGIVVTFEQVNPS